MPCKRCSVILTCMLCTVFMIFNACGLENTEAVQTSVINNYPIPQENRKGTDSSSLCPASTADGFYRASSNTKTVSFYDAQEGKYIILCAQPGCAHTDETCQAWIGNVKSFVEYHGSILAVRQYEDGSADFV